MKVQRHKLSENLKKLLDHGSYIVYHGGYIVDHGSYIVDHGGYCGSWHLHTYNEGYIIGSSTLSGIEIL